MSETTINNFDWDFDSNSDLVVGCDSECKVVDDGTHLFKCPLVWEIWDVYGETEASMPYKCTDRCGDGIMDGPVSSGGVVLRAGDMPTGIKQIFDINKITPYYKGWNNQGEDYSSKLLREQCDNGGVTDAEGNTQGCDDLCQI